MSAAQHPWAVGVWRAVLAASLVLLSACAGPDKPKPATLEPIVPVLGVANAWTYPLGDVTYALDARLVGDTLFLANDNGDVVALNAQTGTALWRTQLGQPLSAGVGSDGRHSAVVTRENELLVLDAGKQVWQHKLSALTLTAPLVAGGRVFTLSADKTVQAFDLASGRRLWQQTRSGDALVLGQAGLLTAVGDTLVVGLGGRLAGLNPLTGQSRWEAVIANSRGTNEVERLADVVAGFSRDADQLCVRAFQYAVACLDAKTGRTLWTQSANGASGLSGDSAQIVGTESDGKVIAWRRADGERLWTSERLRFRGLSAPLLVGNTVVVGDASGMLHFLSKQDATALNRVGVDGSALAARPLVVGQTLVVVTRKGTVQAFRPE